MLDILVYHLGLSLGDLVIAVSHRTFRQLCVLSALAILAGVPLFATVSFGASGISLVATITVRNNPMYLAFNPSNGYVYVSNYHNDARGSISIINGRTNTVLKNVVVGNGPSEYHL